MKRLSLQAGERVRPSLGRWPGGRVAAKSAARAAPRRASSPGVGVVFAFFFFAAPEPVRDPRVPAGAVLEPPAAQHDPREALRHVRVRHHEQGLVERAQRLAHVAHEAQPLRASLRELDGPHALHLSEPPLDLRLFLIGQRPVHFPVEPVPHELAHVLAADRARVRAAEPLSEVRAEVGDAILSQPQEAFHVLPPVGIGGGIRVGLLPVPQVPPVHEPRRLERPVPGQDQGQEQHERQEQKRREQKHEHHDRPAEAEVRAGPGDERVPRMRRGPPAHARQPGVRRRAGQRAEPAHVEHHGVAADRHPRARPAIRARRGVTRDEPRGKYGCFC